jgi:hypothetical protein
LIRTHRENTSGNILIRPFQPGDELAFRALNEAWITRFFVLEEKDRLTLGDPQKYIRRTHGAAARLARRVVSSD